MSGEISEARILRASASFGLAAGWDGRGLRVIAIAAGLCWTVVFVFVALRYELEAYGDGSIFSYSVAVRDAWAFHWHNISGRVFVYLSCFIPAEVYVWLTGDPQGGIAAYGFLFYVAPLIGLAATWSADRSTGRILFVYACASTACLLPLVFGFPTEMWMTHTLFWPALALCHYAGRSAAGATAMFVTLLALVLTHAGGVLLALVILLTVALRGWSSPVFLRAAGTWIAVMAIWAGVKAAFPPDAYFASILPRAAWTFVDPTIFLCPICILMYCTMLGYGLAFLAISRVAPTHAGLYAAAATALALAIYWLRFDEALHAEYRYYLRTAVFVGVPGFAVAASIQALYAQSRLPARLQQPLQRLAAHGAGIMAARACAGALLVMTLVYTVETAKFVVAWNGYKTAVRALAMGTTSDPNLGDPRFVSADRIARRLEPMAWFSTTQYLSVLLAPGFAPHRLVVDPSDDYFWIGCEVATANRRAERAIPAQSRELIRVHTCQHRPQGALPPPAK